MKLSIIDGIYVNIDVSTIADDILNILIQAFTRENELRESKSSDNTMLHLRYVYIELSCLDDKTVIDIRNNLCMEKLKRSYVGRETLLRDNVTKKELEHEYERIYKANQLIETNIVSVCVSTQPSLNSFNYIYNEEKEEEKEEEATLNLIKKCENYVNTGIYDLP